MKFLTSLFIFLIPTLSLVVLQYSPYILDLFRSSPSNKVETSSGPFSVAPSSVWCSECNRGHKCCEFQNLYFFPGDKTFGFVLSEESKVHGISSGIEFRQLLTSSVVNHTEFFLPLVIFSKSDPFLKSIKSMMRSPMFLLNRFKPDNLMHALHDDILPLFSRYETLCAGDVLSCTSKFLLAYIDNDSDYNLNWYKVMSKSPIFNLTSLQEPVLISTAHVGLPGDTVVYQYGFGRPQGPVSIGGNSVGIYRRFAEHMLNYFSINANKRQVTDALNLLLIVRKETRRILNEHELLRFAVQSVQNTLGMEKLVEVKELDLSSVELRQIIAAFSRADLIIGMHGAATFLAGVFSRPNCSILEMFPYGISAAIVSPLHSLSKLQGCPFHYVSWENKDEKATVPPPDSYPVLIGGLGSLSEEDRNFAKKQVPVPAVQCCHNATYLYRMFQDTKVAPSVQYALLKAVQLMKKNDPSSWTSDFFAPGPVRDIVCLSEVEGSKIFWKTPLNVESNIVKSELNYEITARTGNGDVIEVTETNVYSEFKDLILSEIWVRACRGSVCGKDTFAACI